MASRNSGSGQSRYSSRRTSARERSGVSGASRGSFDPNNNVSSAEAGQRSAGKSSTTRDRFRVPEFKTRGAKDTQRVDPDSNMYNEDRLGFSRKDIRAKKKGIESELSIFAPHGTELVPGGKENEIIMERPVTPIDREIRRQPHEWDHMSQYVRRRVAPDKKVNFLSIEDQTDLSEILVAEVYHIWPDIKRQIDDPFLSLEENKELNRRIAVHVTTVCEELYQHYLAKAQILMHRGVFSGPANMSRLKAQLGIEASKYFNVLTIRRYIVADMKGDLPELESVTDASIMKKYSGKRKPSIPQLSFKGMLKKSRPKREESKRHWNTAAQDIKEIKENMPELETSKLLTVLSEMPRELLEGYTGYVPEAEEEAVVSGQEPERRLHGDIDTQTRRDIHSVTEKAVLKRSSSNPEIQVGENLLQELGIELSKPFIPQKTSRDEAIPQKRITKAHHSSFEVLFDSDTKTATSTKSKFEDKLSRDIINLDLKMLTEVKKEPLLENDDDDLPPLLQAIIRHAKHDGMEEKHKQQISDLEEKERRELEERSAPLKEPQFPQPATVAQKITNKTIVRTSDIRVSERICMENVTINKYSTVYNDLLDEIDSTMVKNLDANLFLGEEIKEVYTEIMKTVPRDHLNCEQNVATALVRPDELIEKAPTGIDLYGLMASSSLTMRRNCDRMINPSLKVRAEPPWGGKEDRSVWSKTYHEKKMPGLSAHPQLALVEILNAIMSPDTKGVSFIMGEGRVSPSFRTITPESMPGYMDGVYPRKLRNEELFLERFDLNAVLASHGYGHHYRPHFTITVLTSQTPMRIIVNAGRMQIRANCKLFGDPVCEFYRGPVSPPKDSKGAAHFDPLMPSPENIAFASDPQNGKIGGIALADLPSLVAERMSRSYASWLAWWKGTINSDDYMKYLATQETDYLGVINHFYDSDGEEDEGEESQSAKIDALNKELEEQKVKKLGELRVKKQEYTPGMWNAQAVLLGGLGKDPDVEDDDEIGRIRSAIQKEAAASQSKKKILGDILKDRIKSAGLVAGAASQYGGATPRTGASSRGFTSHVGSTMTGTAASVKGETKNAPSYQDRMEKVWSSLYIPDNIKLDMAIKYSSEPYADNLEEVISAWEAATSLILQREQIISELEAFERLASDPNRFFQHGHRGSSVARLQESKLRSQLQMKLDNIHQRVQQAVQYVNSTYKDTMTYQGRPYLDKMKWDRTEMLYWLQEERKQNALDMHGQVLKKQTIVMTPIAQT